MSKRHQHRQTVLPPKVETRAHAHSERQRISAELQEVANLVSHGVEPDDVIEPGPNFKPMHHHDAEVGIELAQKASFRHWKSKAWKRRKAVRRQRAMQIENLRDAV